MLDSIPFSIPLQFAEGLTDGSIIRIGSLLKDGASGQILAHLQETGFAQQLLSNAVPMFASPQSFAITQTANLVSSGLSNIQLHQLKGMVEGLQLLQYSNIGVAVAGLGVSVLGFMVINKKLKELEVSISDLSGKMSRYFQDLYEREMRQRFSNIYVLFERSDQIPHLQYPVREWIGLEEKLAFESGFLRTEIGHHLSEGRFNPEWLNLLTTTLLLCNATRIHCLLQGNEMAAAQHASKVIANTYTELFDGISQSRLANRMMPEGVREVGQELITYQANQKKAKTIVAGLREVTDSALSKPLLIEHLISKGISGSDFIAQIRAQNQYPIVLLTP